MASTNDTSTEFRDNKDLIRRWIAFANAGFPGSLDQFIARDYVGHIGTSVIDREELERLERQFCEAFPDVRHSIDDLVAEGDRVVLRTTAQATHRGLFEGIEPTGRAVEFTGSSSTESRTDESRRRGEKSTSCGFSANCAGHNPGERFFVC